MRKKNGKSKSRYDRDNRRKGADGSRDKGKKYNKNKEGKLSKRNMKTHVPCLNLIPILMTLLCVLRKKLEEHIQRLNSNRNPLLKRKKYHLQVEDLNLMNQDQTPNQNQSHHNRKESKKKSRRHLEKKSKEKKEKLRRSTNNKPVRQDNLRKTQSPY